jgi:hypothetical protein
MNSSSDREHIKNSTRLLSVLSKTDNLSIFMFAANGDLKAEIPSLQKLGLSKKVYYTRLKQLVDAGLVEKFGNAYKHTSLGKIIYQKHIIMLMEQIKNTEHLRMIDTLRNTNKYSEDEIAKFVSQIAGISSPSEFFIPNVMPSSSSQSKIVILWRFEDMVSAIVERVAFCKSEILLATRSFNEIIINSILRKADSGVDVKVLTDLGLVKQYLEIEGSKTWKINDKNSAERINVIANPWYPGKIERKIAKVPSSMIIFDGKEVGIEVLDWNDPTKFYGTIFIKDDKTLNSMLDFYHTMWNNALPYLKERDIE